MNARLAEGRRCAGTRSPGTARARARWSPRARRLRAWLLGWCALLPAAVRAEVFYGIGPLTNAVGMFTVDTVTGGPATQIVTFAAPLPNGSTLATRPSDGSLFYLDRLTANPNLWRFDPATPAVAPVLVGTPGATTTNLTRLGFDAAGNLFATDAATFLWRLDPSTGAILSVTALTGAVPVNGGDLCLHPTTGVLYMVAGQQLYTVSAFGAIATLGTITGLPGNTSGCAFAADGTLVVSPGATLYRVNIGTLTSTALTATGVATFGDLGTAPGRVADLRLSKTASNATPGTTVSFTISVTNDGPVRATGVRVLDLLPAGVTFVSATVSQGVYSTAAVGSIPAGTWRVGSVNAGATATLTLNATVTGTTPITNTAQVSYSEQADLDSRPNNNVAAEDDQASVTITPSADLRVVKTATSAFAVGTNATYSLTVNNTLGALTTGANAYTVTDAMPTGLSLVSAAGTGWNCAASTPTQMSCTSSAAIAAGAANANAITLTVLPSAAAAPSVTNTAAVAGGGEPPANAANNTSTIATSVCDTTCPDLAVNKTLSTANLTVGTPSTYTLSVTNGGGLATSGAYTLTDVLPLGITLNAAPTAGAGWSCAANTPLAGDNVAGGGRVLCTRSTVIAPAGVSTTVTFPVAVANTAVPSVTNTASIAGGGEPASATGNNATSLTTTVVDFDLAVTKVKTTAANFDLGVNTATYTVTVSNVGGRATTGTYTVTDTLPAGLTLNAAPTAGAGWSCPANTPLAGDNVVAGGRVVCTRATVIAVGASSTTIVFPVRVAAAAVPSVTNTAAVSHPTEAAALTGNNSSSVTTPVNAPDLVVTKSHNGNFTVGVNGVYTLTVTNLGLLTTSTNPVVVTDTLPAGLTFVSGTGTNWSCSAAGPVVTCTRPAANPIAANASAPPIALTVAVGAAAAAASPVVNAVTVSGGNEPPANAGNNADTDSTEVYYSPVIGKSFAPASIPAGGTAALTLTITNPAGNSVALAGLGVTDAFPAGMAVAAVPGFANSCGGTVAPGTNQGDTLLVLTGGATGGPGSTCTITVNVTSTAVGANINTTGAVTSTNSGTGNTAQATLTVTAPAAPTLTLRSSPDPVGVNMPVTLTYTINNSTVANTNLGFTHNFPVVAGAQLLYRSTVSNSCTAGGASLTNPAGGALAAGVSTGIRLFNGYDPAANATCTSVVTATLAAAGTVTTVNGTPGISGLTGTGGFLSNVNDTFNVRAATLTKVFNPTSIVVASTSILTFTVTNGTGNPAQGAPAPVNSLLGFTETLPAGVTVATTPTAAQCSGTVTATPGGGTITFSGGALAAGLPSCSILVSVTANAAGVYDNLAVNVTGLSLNLVNSVNATLTVTSGVMPALAVAKSATAVYDPFSNTTNPRSIPGGISAYTVRVTNTAAGAVDASPPLTITDTLPASIDLFVGDLGAPGTGPVAFTDGTPTSGLTWSFVSLASGADSVDFSTDGVAWTYTPTPDVDGFDPAVRYIRMRPVGSFNGAGAGNPFAELEFRVRIR